MAIKEAPTAQNNWSLLSVTWPDRTMHIPAGVLPISTLHCRKRIFMVIIRVELFRQLEGLADGQR
jgi:hypothetical protein